jgi:glutathione-regulated potassium-efflux system ancillary protein KefG
MRTLVIIVHPHLNDGSRANKQLKDGLIHAGHVTIHDLYEAYPNGLFDVEQEQSLLLKHDRIIIQFPFWWYSSPYLLKKWIDEVLTFGWAFGPGGNKLHDKELGLAITTGSTEESYGSSGYNLFTMNEMTRPYEVTCSLIGMKFLPLFTVHNAGNLLDKELEQAVEKYMNYVTAMYATT